MDFLDKATTQFVRDRIKEAAWANSAYISDLCQMESIIRRHGLRSVMEAMLLASLRSRYPVEFRCIMDQTAVDGGPFQSPMIGESR